MAEEKTELTPEEIQSEREGISEELWGEGTKVDAPLVDDTDPEPEPVVKEAEPDPWAGVSPALRERFESMDKRLEDYDAMTERLKQAENRIGGITNKLHDAEKENAALSKDKDDAPTEDDIAAAAKSEEAWEDLQEEFPVWAEAIDTRLAAERAKFGKSLETVEDLKKQIAALGPETGKTDLIERVREELKVEIQHPGWEETVKSKEYGEWFKDQPADIQAKANSVKATDAIKVLDLYSDHTSGAGKTPAQIEADRKRRLTNSELPSGRTRVPAISEDDMTEEEYRQKVANEVFADD